MQQRIKKQKNKKKTLIIHLKSGSRPMIKTLDYS